MPTPEIRRRRIRADTDVGVGRTWERSTKRAIRRPQRTRTRGSFTAAFNHAGTSATVSIYQLLHQYRNRDIPRLTVSRPHNTFYVLKKFSDSLQSDTHIRVIIVISLPINRKPTKIIRAGIVPNSYICLILYVFILIIDAIYFH